MKRYWPIIIILVSVFLIHLLGHENIVIYFIWPTVVLGIGTWYILEYTKLDLNITSLLISTLIIINDLLLRIYGGGIHDLEGNFWVLFISGGTLFVVIALIIGNGVTKKIVRKTIISLIVPTILISTYLVLFGTLGMTIEKLPSKSIAESENENLLVSELNFSKKEIIAHSDTLHIRDGWVESILRIEDKGFKFDSIRLERLRVIIKLEGRFDKYCFNDSVKYKIDLSGYNHRSILCSSISFTIDSLIDTIPIIFYNANDDEELVNIKAIPNSQHTP